VRGRATSRGVAECEPQQHGGHHAGSRRKNHSPRYRRGSVAPRLRKFYGETVSESRDIGAPRFRMRPL